MSAADSPLLPDAKSRLLSGPNFDCETALMRRGIEIVAGVDEVGRGPLAGPVVAAAVVLDPGNIPDGLHDSKKLSEARREQLFTEIVQAAHVAWASLPARTIDMLNIRQATLKTMERAVQNLPAQPDHVLIDGRDVPPDLTGRGSAMVKGDSRSVSIAAASIIAKVVRDRMMVCAAIQWPQYGFEKHKGYGSKFHRDAIVAHGPCPLHRRSFAPLKHMDFEK